MQNQDPGTFSSRRMFRKYCDTAGNQHFPIPPWWIKGYFLILFWIFFPHYFLFLRRKKNNQWERVNKKDSPGWASKACRYTERRLFDKMVRGRKRMTTRILSTFLWWIVFFLSTCSKVMCCCAELELLRPHQPWLCEVKAKQRPVNCSCEPIRNKLGRRSMLGRHKDEKECNLPLQCRRSYEPLLGHPKVTSVPRPILFSYVQIGRVIRRFNDRVLREPNLTCCTHVALLASAPRTKK